jgi:hypothetical protein
MAIGEKLQGCLDVGKIYDPSFLLSLMYWKRLMEVQEINFAASDFQSDLTLTSSPCGIVMPRGKSQSMLYLPRCWKSYQQN